MIYYQCPSCQAAHASADLLAGMHVLCKKCKHSFEVPKSSTLPAPEASPAPPPVTPAPEVMAAPPPPMAPRQGDHAVPPAEAAPSRFRLFALIAFLFLVVGGFLGWLVFRNSA